MTEEDKWRKTIDSYLTPAELISAMNKMFEYIEQTLNKHEADLEELKLDKRLRQAIREQMQKNIEEEAKESQMYH